MGKARRVADHGDDAKGRQAIASGRMTRCVSASMAEVTDARSSAGPSMERLVSTGWLNSRSTAKS